MRGYNTATAVALLAGLGMLTGALPAAAQQQGTTACDQDNNGYVSASEARSCAESDWSAIVGEEESMNRERFDERWSGADDVDQMWEEADANRDGRVTSEEWNAWQEQRFSAATEGDEQGLPSNRWNRYSGEFRADDESGTGDAQSPSGGNDATSVGRSSAGAAGASGGGDTGSLGGDDDGSSGGGGDGGSTGGGGGSAGGGGSSGVDSDGGPGANGGGDGSSGGGGGGASGGGDGGSSSGGGGGASGGGGN
jgi:hypothetical protein